MDDWLSDVAVMTKFTGAGASICSNIILPGQEGFVRRVKSQLHNGYANVGYFSCCFEIHAKSRCSQFQALIWKPKGDREGTCDAEVVASQATGHPGCVQ